MSKKISYVVLGITLIFIFRKFFLPGPLVAGDAPYFYSSGLKELTNLPVAWTSRGNSFGGINLFLWIYPLMAIYGTLGTFLHLNNDIIIRILFYFPSLIFGFIGVSLLTKRLQLSKVVTFFATLVYLINTYFLLLIDGGQVGVVLAYGLFPFVLNYLISNNFLIALSACFILTIVDFRIAAICIFTAILIKPNWKKLKFLIFITVCLTGLSAYWIIPILKLTTNAISVNIAGLQTTSLLNTLSLSSPNWPTNEFGKTVAPYFYFMFVPILIFLPLFVTKGRKFIWLTLLFLIFAFLAKGAAEPFGLPYTFLINNQVGSVFRDATKFFIPLILIGGILIGGSAEFLFEKFKSSIFIGVICCYIILLVWQGALGKLNGVLGKNPNLTDFQKMYKLLSEDKSIFFRSAWFVEKSPFAFHTEEKQALDAKDLINFRPFASMNVGTGDHFNFINDDEYLDWFNLMGIKYLFFNGNPRVTTLNKSDLTDWNRLLGLVSKNTKLQKLNLGTIFPVYLNPDVMPHEFFVDKTFIIVGGDDIYKGLKSVDQNFSINNQGFLFPEDGKFDPASLKGIASSSAVLLFNNKSENDLKMSFLQKNFTSPTDAYFSQWAMRQKGDYLNWKYELLQKNIDTHEFDYNMGIAFSSQSDEELKFSMKVPEDGSYYLEIRSMDASGSGDLLVNFDNTRDLIKRKSFSDFEWYEKGPINLKAGSYSLNLQNTHGVQVVNAVALIPVSDMKIANQSTQNFIGTFPNFNLSNQNDLAKVKDVINTNHWSSISDGGQNIKKGWIIYTDSYNFDWALGSTTSLPMYSMINGFYVNSVINKKPAFSGNNELGWGIYFSALSFLTITTLVLWRASKKI